MSALIPNCVSYDPTFGHELAVIIQDGLRRMVQNQENVYYYITVMNENYPQPGLTKGDEEGIIRRPWSGRVVRSEEHTSELQSLMRISYAVFCLKKKNKKRK